MRGRAGEKRTRDRLTAGLLAAALVIAQFSFFALAGESSFGAGSGGGDLEVRVKYFGEMSNAIRTKHVFTQGELESLGMVECCYSNVTKVGTVLSIHAVGPQVTTIIEAAGIDPASVQRINFRAGDDYGYTRDFTMDHHINGERWYYPALSSHYESQGSSLLPLEGALQDGDTVPAILALRYGSTKEPDAIAEELPLETSGFYRFCMGQTRLTEGTPTGGADDVTSADSIKKIHGIDVTLYGSPVEDIMMDISDMDLKVGSKKKISVSYSGEELFADDLAGFAGKLTWKSSDPSVVSVDQNGMITVHKKGTATITVTAENGMSASVAIRGVGEAKKEPTAAKGKSGKNSGATQTEETKKKATTKKATKPTTKKPKKKTKKKKNNQGQNNVTQKRTSGTTRNTSTAATIPSTVQKEKKMIVVREISLEELAEAAPMSAQDKMRAQMSEDAQALGKTRSFRPGVAAGAGGGALIVGGAGAALRIRRFLRDTR